MRCLFSRCDESKIVYCSVDTLFAVQLETKGEFIATNFSERSDNKTKYDVTAISQDLTIFIETALNN